MWGDNFWEDSFRGGLIRQKTTYSSPEQESRQTREFPRGRNTSTRNKPGRRLVLADKLESQTRDIPRHWREVPDKNQILDVFPIYILPSQVRLGQRPTVRWRISELRRDPGNAKSPRWWGKEVASLSWGRRRAREVGVVGRDWFVHSEIRDDYRQQMSEQRLEEIGKALNCLPENCRQGCSFV